ncbi:MAG: FKBP-type peptidyl-prolyl cis-trans isomerase [Nitrospiraceae bacterium]|nr:FKBP-type peptidyl-prolyl cis-trans isomerase [Nitrospiraceae bacterium]
MMRIKTLLAALAGGLAFFSVTHAETDLPVAAGATVIMEYTITVPEAKIIIPKNVSQFVPGHHDLLPNLEKALAGMREGEERRVDLSADEAFGPYDETKKAVIAADHLPADVKAGMVLTTKEGVPFVVTNVTGGEAQVDFNHPLAGKHVIIDVKILEVQPPASASS